VEWQTFAKHGLYVIWLDDLARFILDSNLRAVEMGNLEVYTSQSLQKSYLLLNQKICTLAFEKLVRLLLNNYNDITWLDAGVFVGLAMEDVLLVVWCTLIDFCLDDLFLLHNLLAIAVLAFVLFINDFTFAITVIAGARRLSVHAWSKHLHSCHHAAAFARAAFLDSTFFTTLAIALITDSLAIYSYLCLFATVNFFQSDF
jgi:hypothetical protein